MLTVPSLFGNLSLPLSLPLPCLHSLSLSLSLSVKNKETLKKCQKRSLKLTRYIEVLEISSVNASVNLHVHIRRTGVSARDPRIMSFKMANQGHPGAAITKCDRPKQQKYIVAEFWRLSSPHQSVSRGGYFRGI